MLILQNQAGGFVKQAGRRLLQVNVISFVHLEQVFHPVPQKIAILFNLPHGLLFKVHANPFHLK